MNNEFRSYAHQETESTSFEDGRAFAGDLCDAPVTNAGNLNVMRSQIWRRVRSLTLILFAALSAGPQIIAADLKPETLQAWNEYVQAAERRNLEHIAQGASFLAIDAHPAEASKLRQGEVIASPAAPNVPLKVPGGLIHDWTGAIFIPDATLGDVLRVVRDYGQYKAVYHPNVVSAKPVETAEWEDRFSMVVMNKSFFAKSALDSDYRSTFTRLDDQRWYSVSEATRIQEISEYGGPSQHMLPEDHGTGIIWRLFSIARYQERDGGVYVELEAIALSRDIPAGLRWLVDPIVRRVSRSSLVTSLQQTAEAVCAGTNIISRLPVETPALNGPAVRSFR